ncbi:hypothetical protein HK096_002073, partial [Nowakowskiella sp. JEL0078]
MQNKPQLPSLREILGSRIAFHQNQLPPLSPLSPMSESSFQSSLECITPTTPQNNNSEFFHNHFSYSPQDAKQTGSFCLLAGSPEPQTLTVPTLSWSTNNPISTSSLTPATSPISSKTCDLQSIQKIVEEIFTNNKLQPLSINDLLVEMVEKKLVSADSTEQALSCLRRHLSSDPKFTRFPDRNKKYSGEHGDHLLWV